MKFEVVGEITDVEVIARGPGVRVLSYLRKAYGRARRRESKGVATVRLPNGAFREVELHWYEAHAALPGRIVKSATKPFAICIDDTDYKASLIRGKVYQILPDPVLGREAGAACSWRHFGGAA